MDMIFRNSNVKNLYRAGSLKTVQQELEKYNIDLMTVD
jgi:hypothetical protein